MASVTTHHRTSIPIRLGPLPSECYYMVSTYECRHTLHTRVLSVENISNAYKMSVLSSVRTHCRASLPLRLGSLLSECYSTLSTIECGYSPCESNICRAILSKDHSHEQSVIPAILKRGYYRPQVNAGTLYVRVASVGKS